MRPSPPKILTITLHRDALLYDIGLVAYITGDIMPDTDVKAQSGVQDVTNEGNVDVMTRNLNKSYNELVHGLTAFTGVMTRENLAGDNLFVEPENYVLELAVPDNFSAPNVAAATTAAHEYMVNKALAKWFSVTKPNEMELYEVRAREELGKLKTYLNSRVHGVRRVKHPW